MDGYSQTPLKERLEALRSLIPEAFAEGKIDWEKLKAALGEEVNFSNERYVLNWAGKSDAFRIMQQPSAATLVPCKEESVDFDNTENIFIEGENMEVLKVLQKSYFGKVKMIYIDPPYNTGNDSFIYPDKFSETKEEYQKRVGDLVVSDQLVASDQFPADSGKWVVGKDSIWKANRKENGQYHSNWLNMMMPRLYLAKSLLRDDGVIFVSIDDNEVHNLRLLMNEIFGEENFLAQFIWHSRQNKDNRNITGVSIDHEYILCFSKQSGNRIFEGTKRKIDQYSNPDNDPRGDWTSANMVGLATIDARPNLHYDLINPTNGINYGCPAKGWRYDKKTMSKLILENRIIWPESPTGRPRKKSFLNEINDLLPGYSSIIEDGCYTNTATKEIFSLFDAFWFDFPKPTMLIKHFIEQITNENDLILDFFAGSGTTAHAVMQLNKEDGGHRKFICVQLPEPCDEKSEAYKAGYNTIAEISKERIRRAGRKVASEQWTVISKNVTEEEINKYGCKELQRTRCLAKGNDGGQASLFDCEETSPRGEVRAIGSNEESGSVNSFKHSGGTGTELIGGICPVYFHSTGISCGTGDPNTLVREHRVSETRGDDGNSSTISGDWQNVECPRKGTIHCPLMVAKLPVASDQLSERSSDDISLGTKQTVTSYQLPEELSNRSSLKTGNWKLATGDWQPTTGNRQLLPDTGFKVFKLQDSNFKQWRNIPGAKKEEWKQQIIDFINPVAENATVENMMYELLLKSGKSLNSKIEKLSVASDQLPEESSNRSSLKTGNWQLATGNCPLETDNRKLETTYLINGGELALLLESVSQATVDAVLSRHPQKVIALDKLFEGNDQLKTNTALQMRDAGVEFKTI